MGKLAVNGGTPACEGLVWRRSLIGEQEKNAVINLLEESMKTGKAFDRYGGIHVDEYEKEFAQFVEKEYATAVSSGTAAVHTALAALRLEPGTEVVCAPITDPGAISPVLLNLCIPVFADTDPDTFNMTREGVEKILSEKTGAIVTGHIAGEPADIGPIAELAQQKGLPLIEDCAQAHGALYKGKVVGSFGDAGAFSLMSGKHHTSGGQGGMVVTDDWEIYITAKRFADRGKPFESDSPTNLFMGVNYRMTDLEACIGRVQLERLPSFIKRRQERAEYLFKQLEDLESVRPGKILEDTEPVYWFLRLFIDESKLTVTKEEFAKAIEAEGVPAAPTYSNIVYKQKWFKEKNTFGTSGIPWTLPQYGQEISYEDTCPNAEKALATHMMIYFNESVTEEHMDKAAEAFQKVEKAYLK